MLLHYVFCILDIVCLILKPESYIDIFEFNRIKTYYDHSSMSFSTRLFYVSSKISKSTIKEIRNQNALGFKVLKRKLNTVMRKER